MRYYVIINGINSLTIPGLAIKDLPPISKTLMRNQKETIDGRDGDIITELGYSAYDKALTIGLYGSYDINDIIAFFNQKGTIVFSDEPDKYYNFTILDQIDYDKLVKFRTATIRIHCQPFKYPVSETPVEIEAEYVTAQGEEMTLNNTGVAPLEIGLKGNTYQETTTGKQLFNVNGTIFNGSIEKVGNGFKLTNDGTNRTLSILLPNSIPAGTYKVTYEMKNSTLSASNMVGISIRNSGGESGNGRTSSTGETTITTTGEADRMYIYMLSSEASGTTVTLDNFMVSTSGGDYEPYTNGASPNPDYPQEVQVVSGDNTININNKNLFDTRDYAVSSQQLSITRLEDGAFLVNGTNTSNVHIYAQNYIKLDGNCSLISLGEVTTTNIYVNIKNGSTTVSYLNLHNNIKYKNFTTTNAATTLDINIEPGTYDNYVIKCMIVKGTYTDTTIGNYIAPQSQEYEINLGTLELCKIGNYQDYIYKSGENWYKHTEIAKTKLLSTWNWFRDNEKPNSWRYYSQSNAIPNSHNSEAMSNYFKGDTIANVNNIDSQAITTINNIQIALRINKSIAPTVDDLKTWLSNNEVYDYTILTTPTEEQITNAELIEQLEAILNAVSYEDQTNISQENDNLPFILDVSALQKGTNEAIIDNDGNIYSKPIINIVGDGIVGVSLNGSQILSLDMTTYNDITIDTETMEAYDSNGLRNRQVTGNYNNLRLQPGENTISLNGGFTSATISKYKRWL